MPCPGPSPGPARTGAFPLGTVCELIVQHQQAVDPLRLGGHLGVRLSWLWLELGFGKLRVAPAAVVLASAVAAAASVEMGATASARPRAAEVVATLTQTAARARRRRRAAAEAVGDSECRRRRHSLFEMIVLRYHKHNITYHLCAVQCTPPVYRTPSHRAGACTQGICTPF